MRGQTNSNVRIKSLIHLLLIINKAHLSIEDNNGLVLEAALWHSLCRTAGFDPLRVAHVWSVCDGHRGLLRLALGPASQPTGLTLWSRFIR